MSQAPYGPTPAAWPTQGPPPGRGPSRLPTIIAIVIALVAVAVAVGAWFRPAPKAETAAPRVYSEQETADAKKAVCDAFDRGQQTLSVTGSKTGTDTNNSFIVAVNSRVAISSVIAYWRNAVQREPATPNELADDLSAVATTYEDILLRLLADASESDLSALYTSVDASVPKMTQACK